MKIALVDLSLMSTLMAEWSRILDVERTLCLWCWSETLSWTLGVHHVNDTGVKPNPGRWAYTMSLMPEWNRILDVGRTPWLWWRSETASWTLSVHHVSDARVKPYFGHWAYTIIWCQSEIVSWMSGLHHVSDAEFLKAADTETHVCAKFSTTWEKFWLLNENCKNYLF